MATRLNIILDGSAPGLPEHALSISAFGEPLYRLVTALQRIASGLLKDAVGEEYGARGGQHTPVGRSIDVQIISVVGRSPLDVGFEIVARLPGTLPFIIDDLTDATTDRFLEAVEKESRGHPANVLVRRFLASYPSGVARQEYVFHPERGTGRTVTVNGLDLPTSMQPLPYVSEFHGLVIGLGFEPGRSEVRLQNIADNSTLTCSASPEQVENAVAFRGSEVLALVVRGPKKTRLLGLWRPGESIPMLDGDKAKDYLFSRWDSLLKRLAE